MNNASASLLNAPDLSSKYALIAVGLLMVCMNAIVLFTIIFQRTLRKEKEYVILIGLAVADGLDGIPSISAAVYSLWLIAADPLSLPAGRTRLECMFLPNNWLFVFTDNCQCLMMLTVSLDRLFAVSFPLHYYTMRKRYAWSLVGGVFGYSLATTFAAWIFLLADNPETKIHVGCMNRFVYGRFNVYLNATRMCFSYGSVGVYAVVWLVYRGKSNGLMTAGARMREVRERRQRRLTITLGLQTLATFFLYIIPMMVAMQNISLQWIMWLYIFSASNAFVNLFIYWWRLKEFRLALKLTMCSCRQLTVDSALWYSKKNTLSKKSTSDVGAQMDTLIVLQSSRDQPVSV